jgi:hypothetical protein
VTRALIGFAAAGALAALTLIAAHGASDPAGAVVTIVLVAVAGALVTTRAGRRP